MPWSPEIEQGWVTAAWHRPLFLLRVAARRHKKVTAERLGHSQACLPTGDPAEGRECIHGHSRTGFGGLNQPRKENV